MALDRVHDLAVAALLALHVHGDDGVDRRDQQQHVEHDAEDHAGHDQDKIEQRRKRLAVDQKPNRRQQGGENVDHDLSLQHERASNLVTP